MEEIFIFQTRVFKVYGYKDTKFQLNIFKIMPALRPKKCKDTGREYCHSDLSEYRFGNVTQISYQVS